MERKSTSEETQGLSADDLCDHRLKKAYGGGVGRLAVSLTLLGAGGDYFLEPSYSKRLGAVAPLPMSETIFNSCSPGAIHPGIFFGYCGLLPASPDENSRRRPLDQRGDISQFHESDLGDVYDLYNACNGMMLGGLLDVRKLDELSPEEMEALDVERLREVWAHTAAGCITCAGIIRTLNAARGILREERIGAPADGPKR
jgi:hypothetical protein